MSLHEKLAKRAARAGLRLQPAVSAKLEAYFELLKKWNPKVSLTSLPVSSDADEAIDRLLVEPLVAARHFPDHPSRIVDVGTGGGSPALPLKILLGGVPMTMVESRTRKSAFLREAARQLDLANATVETGRLEVLVGRPAFRDLAEIVTVRAVRLDSKMLSQLQLLLRPGGRLFIFTTGATTQSPKSEQVQLDSRQPLLPHLTSWLLTLIKSDR